MDTSKTPESGTISSTLWQQICEKRLEVMLVSLLVYTTGLFDTVSSQIGGVC